MDTKTISTEIDQYYQEDLQLAENENIDLGDNDNSNDYEEKRKLLEKTKIVKQTWSISEIYQKIKSKKLILDPIYQREHIWDKKKQTSFIESLYMGITIPPIYVVEIPSDDIILSDNVYEVVDGKQRLTTIYNFIENKLKLETKVLEYYADIFKNNTFAEIREIEIEKTNEMLSSVLDIYVITANSPEFTKYDIFARLNKGSEPLKVNEIRRAIYQSPTLSIVNNFIKEILDLEETDKNNKRLKQYNLLFSKRDIQRFDDYGRFYKSIAFYIRSDIESKVVNGYNSRPREMINSALQELQKEVLIKEEVVYEILNGTIDLLDNLKDINSKNYIVDACIPFIVSQKENLFKKLDDIKEDEKINSTFLKSPATTKNVNYRFERVIEILGS